MTTKRMWRLVTRCGLGLAAAAAILTPVAAQAQIQRVTGSDARQSIGITLGGFIPRGEDGRSRDDVLRTDLDTLAFEIKDFTGFAVGGEWLAGLGDFADVGVGVGFYQRTVPSVYRSLQNKNGSEIEQDLKLRIIPTTATIRFLPVGRGKVQPYVGAGIGVFSWRYSETGEFVDFSDNSIFRESYTASGNAFGPVILGGIRFPVGDAFLIGGEARYQKAEGDTKPADSGLLGSKIDLGGWTTSLTMHIRF